MNSQFSPGPRRRFSREVRREQIVKATLDLIAEHGVRGTTLSRIADRVGVTTPALYAHFRNRREILLAALDVLMEHRTSLHREVPEGNAFDRLRTIEGRHSQLLGRDDRSVLALFEFIAAPPEEGLRETLGQKHLVLIHHIADLIRQAQREGSVRPDVDPLQTAWMLVSRAWTEDIAHLMGISHEWNEARSLRMLDFILDSIATTPPQGDPAAPAVAARRDAAAPPAPTPLGGCRPSAG